MFHCSMVTWEMERKSSSGWLLTCFLCSLHLLYTSFLLFFALILNAFIWICSPFYIFTSALFLSWQCFEACCSHPQKSRCREVWSTTSAFSRLWRDGLSALLSPPSSKMLPLWSSNKTLWPNSHLNLQNKHGLIRHSLLWTAEILNVLTGF